MEKEDDSYHFPNAIHDKVDDLFTDSIMTSSVVVGSILLTIDELFRVE